MKRTIIDRIAVAVLVTAAGAGTGIALAVLIAAAGAAELNDRPNCIAFGSPAVCHSDAVVNAAGRIAARRCPRKNFNHADWALSLDINEGPYGDPRELARTICMLAH